MLILKFKQIIKLKERESITTSYEWLGLSTMVVHDAVSQLLASPNIQEMDCLVLKKEKERRYREGGL
jgi:hypothetical protein